VTLPRLGLAAPVFAAAGVPGMRTPSVERVAWGDVLHALLLADELGYESAWFSDHLFHGVDGAFLESWTTASAAAVATRRLRIVTNHLNINLRPAPVIARMATTLDEISGGRLELFLSGGLREREHTGYGLGWEPDFARRTARLAEAVDVIRLLWTGEPVDFTGDFFRLDGAISAPRPARAIPIWLGGPLTDDAIRLIAAKADGWNSLPASLDRYAADAARIDDACRAIGRDPATLRRSLETQVLVLDDAADWRERLAAWSAMRARSPQGFATADMFPAGAPVVDAAAERELLDVFVIGTRDEVHDRLAAYGALGVEDVACWFMDWPAEDTLHALAERERG
jgi:alkanesulfonate monooxygenase SsuD/methylene tetrahydromethanopterin reductase-like flavin-dependent oxidoreductase (luciferase family)